MLDGEVVAFDGEQTSFSRLQQRLGVTNPSPELVAAYPVVLLRFDLLELDGDDLESAAARAPREADGCNPAERGVAAQRGVARDSQRRFAEACRAGWEGLIAKRAAAPYVAGRSRDWLKLKCVWEQEFVIGGYTDPAGSRTDFGALLVGYYEDGRLRYAGKVGTGYTAATLRELGARLRELQTPESPFVDARRSPAARTGLAPSSSPRSASPSGPTTVACASRASSACATTSAGRSRPGTTRLRCTKPSTAAGSSQIGSNTS